MKPLFFETTARGHLPSVVHCQKVKMATNPNNQIVTRSSSRSRSNSPQQVDLTNGSPLHQPIQPDYRQWGDARAQANAQTFVDTMSQAIASAALAAVGSQNIPPAAPAKHDQREQPPDDVPDASCGDQLPQARLWFNLSSIKALRCYAYDEVHRGKLTKEGKLIKAKRVVSEFHPAYCVNCRGSRSQDAGWAYITKQELEIINLCRQHDLTNEQLIDLRNDVAHMENSRVIQQLQHMRLEEEEQKAPAYGAYRENAHGGRYEYADEESLYTPSSVSDMSL